MAGFPFAPQTPAFPLGDDDKRMALIQGLLAGGGALMQAGGPSTTPVSTGQAFGSGIGQAMQAMQGAQRQAAAQKQAQLQQQYLQAQTGALTAAAADRQRQEAARTRLRQPPPMPLGPTAAPGDPAQGPQMPLPGGGQGPLLRETDLDMIDAYPSLAGEIYGQRTRPPGDETTVVGPGGALVNKRTGQPVFTAPERPGKPETVTTAAGIFILKPDGTLGARLGSPSYAPAAGSQEQFGLTPIWGTDKEGNAVLIQPSNRGGGKQMDLPPGVTPERGQTSRIDTGTEILIVDAAGDVIRRLPKDVAGAAKQTALGTGEGAAQVSAAAKGTGAGIVTDILDGAESLIEKSTGSYAGALVNEGARVIGQSTEGSRAIAQLKIVQGNLIANMPRMEGPQSNYDVQMYKDNAARIADPTVPRAERLAAVKEIKKIQQKYKDRAAQQPNALVTQPGGGQPQAPAEYDYVPGKGLVRRGS